MMTSTAAPGALAGRETSIGTHDGEYGRLADIGAHTRDHRTPRGVRDRGRVRDHGPMSALHDVVFLFDVDNTLLDNDAVVADFRAYLLGESGREAGERYWTIFEELRREVGYADYLGALQRYRLEREHDPRLLLASSFLLDYPFAQRLYPGGAGGTGAVR